MLWCIICNEQKMVQSVYDDQQLTLDFPFYDLAILFLVNELCSHSVDVFKFYRVHQL